MKKQSKNSNKTPILSESEFKKLLAKSKEIPQIVRQVLMAHLQKKVYHYEEFDAYYKDTKEMFDFLNINKEEVEDFWFDVSNAVI